MMSLWYAIKGLKHRRLRSWLTIIGIAIGIIAIFSLISISLGIDKQIKEEINSFGTRNIMLSSLKSNLVTSSLGFISGVSTFSKKEYLKLKSLPYVESISRILYGKAKIAYKGKSYSATIGAVDPTMFEQVSSIRLESGRRFYDNDKNVVVLGNTIAHDYLDARVGSNIIIDGKSFKIIGILDKITSQGSADDSAIFMSYSDGLDILDMYKKGESAFIWLTIADGYDVKEASENINYILASLRKESPEDTSFEVITTESLQESVGGILSILSAFLGGVGFISIIVGTIGIANTMFMSVIERRKEIGVLKALGMKDKDVLNIFIFESLLMSAIAGIIAITLSIIILYLAREFIPSVINIYLIIGTFILSIFIGVLAGYIPAKRTLNISPVEAMRYD